MKNGFNGKILRVNLSSRTIQEEQLSDKIYRRYLGGSALAIYLLLKELKPQTDPFSPNNVIVFAPGFLTGTPGPGTSRFTVASKSPLTGAFGESEAGGWWGPELKKAGFDAIIITGKASKPVYLWIKNGKAEIRNAEHIWGKVTGEAEKIIRKELGEQRARVALIGPAGEKLVRYACILNELKHANGRTGMGAVMGSKNLKAIAVKGDGKINLYNQEQVRKIVKAVRAKYVDTPGGFGDLGSAGSIPYYNSTGILPTYNFKTGEFVSYDEISGEKMKETILIKRDTCANCFIRCKRVVKVEEPYTVDSMYGGPEYETIGAFGSLCGISDLKAIAKANELCGKYSMDTISTGNTIAFAMECFENGILSLEQTGGLELKFGNAQAMVQLVELIGERKGIGDILAEGVARAAAIIGNGAEKYAMHVKGLEVPLHEPRGKAGVGLQYALSPTGADHMEADHDSSYEVWSSIFEKVSPLGIDEPLDALDLSPKKVRWFVYLQHLFNCYNTLGLCDYVAAPWGPFSINEIVEFAQSVTGWQISLWELINAGERASVMYRLFNIREGFSKEDDTLPQRFFEPLKGGKLKGNKIDPEKFSQAITNYYLIMGYNSNGVPAVGKLMELDIPQEFWPER